MGRKKHGPKSAIEEGDCFPAPLSEEDIRARIGSKSLQHGREYLGNEFLAQQDFANAAVVYRAVAEEVLEQ